MSEAHRVLRRAMDEGRPSLLQEFIDADGNINEPDDEGMTVLHDTAAHGARPYLRVLVNSGKCDYLARDGKGRYAFELAIEWARDYGVGRLLAKKQAQQAHAQGVPAYIPRD